MIRFCACTLLLFLSFPLYGKPTQGKLEALYNSLRPECIAEHLAFYELYPDSPQGKHALHSALTHLAGKEALMETGPVPIITSLDAIISLVNKGDKQPEYSLTEEDRAAIDRLSKRLKNRQLRGYYATTEQEVQHLATEEIDLARGLLLSELGPHAMQKIKTYEAVLDLMALQILGKIPPNASEEESIHAISQFIFEEMRFRFPPQSMLSQDIDHYSFLPSVLDSRRGVCLGVSILYLCLAQRIGVPLTIITPPGHIFVRYDGGQEVCNIETTARGIHLDSEEYLNIDTCKLSVRTMRETIGMAHFNQAAYYWETENPTKAVECYRKAKEYMGDDPVLNEFLGYNLLFKGDKEEGEKLLQEVLNNPPDWTVAREPLAQDYLNGFVDAEGLRATFMPVDETKESILKKQAALQQTLEKFPAYRGGLFHLAITYLQLHRDKEALSYLEKYHELDPTNPKVEYFLSVLYLERNNYPKSWEHFHETEKLLSCKKHCPKVFKALKKQLTLLSPP